ncbi:MAG: UvrD-helicase domain-containing protein [Methanobacteriota archaeon]
MTLGAFICGFAYRYWWCIFVRLSLPCLNPRQLPLNQTHPSPPQLILAGAGTGKTTTITAKIAYMVEKENIDPSQILALTFSKEAARHMREKVEKLLQGREIHVKTFHSFCAELIKERFQNFFREIFGQCHYKLICRYKT